MDSDSISRSVFLNDEHNLIDFEQQQPFTVVGGPHGHLIRNNVFVFTDGKSNKLGRFRDARGKFSSGGSGRSSRSRRKK